MESPQLQFIVVVDIPVIARGQTPMFIEILQLQYIDMVVNVGSAGVVACPLCATTDAVVDDVAQFIDGGGRRCGSAATRSSCRS